MKRHVAVLPAIALAATLAAGACASAGTTPENRQPATTLRVENQRTLDVNVYVVRSGQRLRLGTATALTTETFTIPASVVTPGVTLQFLADPIGQVSTSVSEEVMVDPGDEITLVVPSSG